MKRQILLAIVLVGKNIVLTTALSDDQYRGLLSEDFASTLAKEGKLFITLSEKGKKIYAALESVVSIGTVW